jgi:hypothetical protein
MECGQRFYAKFVAPHCSTSKMVYTIRFWMKYELRLLGLGFRQNLFV